MKENNKNEGEKIANWMIIILVVLAIIIIGSIASAINGAALFIGEGGWMWLCIIAALLVVVYLVSHASGTPRE